MNTDRDYLWDKTGEPDPEIQQLEEILGKLRYQPRALEIPALEQASRRTFPFRGLAIAATLAMMLLGLGLWLGLQSPPTGEVAKTQKQISTTGNSQAAAVPVKDKAETLANVLLAEDSGSKPVRNRLSARHPGPNTTRTRRTSVASTQLTASKRKEAEAVKAQLMLALRVASSKLNYAQKKTQSTNSENLIHNQHKTG